MMKIKGETRRTEEASRLCSLMIEDLRTTTLDQLAPDSEDLPLMNRTIMETPLSDTLAPDTLAQLLNGLEEHGLDASICFEAYQGRMDDITGVVYTMRVSVIVAEEDLFSAGHELTDPQGDDVVVRMSTLLTRGSINP
jgi:hypothetical protein